MSTNLLPIPDSQLTRTALVMPEDMTFDEWADLGDRLERMSEGVMWWVGDWWRTGQQRYGERAKHAAESGRWSFQTFADAGWVAAKFETSRRREVLPFSHHREVAALPEPVADELLDKAEAERWTREELRQQVREVRRSDRVATIVRQHDASPSALGPFPVLYADPPWRYQFAESDTRGIENQYPTMALDEIRDLMVPAAEDSMLFLWATSPKLTEALAVLEEWGFTYRTCMVWVKDRIGMGYYARQQHELLLIGARGDIPAPAPATRPPSVVTAPRAEHSAKPDEVYELIERMYPGYPKCELFQRRPRDGWVGWGNQVEQVSV